MLNRLAVNKKTSTPFSKMIYSKENKKQSSVLNLRIFMSDFLFYVEKT